MISSKLILFSILGLNVILVIFFGVTQHSPSNPNIFLSQIQEENPSHFDDPQIALKILKQLDIFEAVGDKSIKGAKYTHNAGGLTGKKTYCDEHREYFVNNTQEFLEGKNFATNYWKLHKLRTQVIPSMEGAQDLYPGVHPNIRNANDKYEMRTDINIFVSYDLYYYQRQIGKQFSCLSQASNHIPGHDKMYRKDKVGQSLVDYAQKYEKRPHCFNYDKWFPKTWVLQKRDQCLEFFEEFLSPRYQELKAERNVVYFRKIGANVHEGKGVFPVNDQEELHIKLLYQNGAACGKVHDNNLIQYNVYNLLLLENRKFGFRSFLLIASTNPLIAYYHDGYARLSMNEYDPNSKEIKTFVTNIGVNLKEARKGTVYQNMTSAEINEHTFWSMEDFQDYIIENKIINESNYLDNTLRPEFKKVMIHLLRMAQTGFFKKSSVFEIFGLDFVMDRDLNLWFIEANSMPLVDGFSKGSTVLLNRMLVDTYEIVFGLIKSRMKRVIKYVNMLSKNVAGDFEELSDLERRQEEFRELTKNYFEPEFEPSPENTYSRIVYERETGVERYSGLLSEDCL